MNLMMRIISFDFFHFLDHFNPKIDILNLELNFHHAIKNFFIFNRTLEAHSIFHFYLLL